MADLHEDHDHVVIERDSGAGAGLGVILGIILVIVVIGALWYVGIGPGHAVNVNVAVPSIAPAVPGPS